MSPELCRQYVRGSRHVICHDVLRGYARQLYSVSSATRVPSLLQTLTCLLILPMKTPTGLQVLVSASRLIRLIDQPHLRTRTTQAWIRWIKTMCNPSIAVERMTGEQTLLDIFSAALRLLLFFSMKSPNFVSRNDLRDMQHV